MTPEARAHHREANRYYLSFYRTIDGPSPGVDSTLVKPATAREVPKGMPVEEFQKERIVAEAASQGAPNRKAMVKVCREVGIKDAATVSEVVRRQGALSTRYGIRKSETWQPNYREAHLAGRPYGKPNNTKQKRAVAKANKAKLEETSHKKPPKEYREEGATQRNQYADPENYKYPLHTKKNVRAAISYFSQPKNNSMYTPEKRKTMWGRILRAAKRYGIDVSEEVRKRGKMKKNLSFETAAAAAETLDELEKALGDKPIPLATRAELRRVILFAKSWGLTPEKTHPKIMRASGLVLDRSGECATEMATEAPADPSRFMGIFRKSEGAKPGYKLTKKLLKPYLEVTIRNRARRQLENYHWSAQRAAKEAGFVGDNPPVPPPNIGHLAEKVWYTLVQEAGRDYADRNLVAALNMSSITKEWVEKAARNAICDSMKTMVFTPGQQDLSPVTY